MIPYKIKFPFKMKACQVWKGRGGVRWGGVGAGVGVAVDVGVWVGKKVGWGRVR